MQKPKRWRTAAVQAIEKRKMSQLQWQLTLAILSQPTFDADAGREKADMVQDLYRILSGEEDDFVPMDDSDTLALLAMAGRYPVRTLNGGNGNAP